MVSIRAYAEDAAAFRDPEEGYEEHPLTAIIPLEQVAAVGLEYGATIVVKKLVFEMQRTGWPVKSEDEVIVEAGAGGHFTKRLVPGMGRTHRPAKAKK